MQDLNDWNSFISSLQSPLPATFRINAHYEFSNILKKQLHEFAGHTINLGDKEVQPVVSIPWYPMENAYKLGTDRRVIRKSDALEPLHKWMIQVIYN